MVDEIFVFGYRLSQTFCTLIVLNLLAPHEVDCLHYINDLGGLVQNSKFAKVNGFGRLQLV